MASLVNTIRAASQLGAQRALRSVDDINLYALFHDYPIAKWRNDDDVDMDMRRYFSTIACKAPAIDPDADPAVSAAYEKGEYRYNGQEALGLGAALVLEDLALSFATENDWDNDAIELTAIWLCEDAALREATEIVRHASKDHHLETHRFWISDSRFQDVDCGLTLWARRAELFPSLLFCSSSETQICGLASGDPHFLQLTKRLCELDSYCENWSAGPFDPNSIPAKVTVDSVRTLANFGAEREFTCPDGPVRQFSWHARLTPGAWRLFFYPDSDQRRIYIGYVGRKLRTVSDPK